MLFSVQTTTKKLIKLWVNCGRHSVIKNWVNMNCKDDESRHFFIFVSLIYCSFSLWFYLQLLKVTPMSAQAVLSDIKSGGFPWWWNWLERQVGTTQHTTQTPASRPTTGQAMTPKISTRSLAETYPRPSSRSKQTVTGNTNIDASTPRSSNPIKQKYTPNLSNRWQTQGFKDDNSLTSCPAFTVPNYMVPTVSAKAKARDGPPATPEGKRRFSFGLTQSIGSIRWSKGSSVLSTKDSESKRMSGRHRPMHSIGNLSMDSTISLPVGVGGRSFR